MAEPPPLTTEQATDWFGERLPDGWFTGFRVLVDRDEIMIVGTLTSSSTEADDDDEGSASDDTDPLERIEWFREETRDARVRIAKRAERTFQRKVSWATSCGESDAVFTHLSVPVMTRLRLPERQILDTLVAAGVARSRSDALGWCVRLVADHEGEWLEELRDAISAVDRVRAQGPG